MTQRNFIQPTSTGDSVSELFKNAVAYFQTKHPGATAVQNIQQYKDSSGNLGKKLCAIITHDFIGGVKHRGVAIENFGENISEIHGLLSSINSIFEALDAGIHIKMDNALKRTGRAIDTTQLDFSARVTLYTNQVVGSSDFLIDVFAAQNFFLNLVDESEMHKTLFISYGGPDEAAATGINKMIKDKGVKTWFFPDDALPGQKLHRMMHDGVNDHDRVLLICSKDSLTRPGVLNEIERVLEREANEGGTEILIPITLDSFVYTDWAPDRKDIAGQIRSRVIIKVAAGDGTTLQPQIDKVVAALKK